MKRNPSTAMWMLITFFVVVLLLTALTSDPRKDKLIRTEKQGNTTIEYYQTPEGYEYPQIKTTP